jgi:fibronectin type 3 domain-containing protein
VTGYNVYRSTTSGTGYTKVNSTPVNGTSYTDTSVASGTTYYYVVTAVDPHSLESVSSNEVSVSTPPQPPTSLMASAVPGQVTLTWTASVSTTVTGYNVYRSTVSGTGYMKVATLVQGTTYQDSTVASGTTYYYVVTAVGPGNAESVYSNEASATP